MSTATEVLPLPRERTRRSALRFALLAFLITLIAASGLTAGAAMAYAGAFEGRVMPGVSVAGVLLGGLDREAARQRLLSSLPDPGQGELTVTVGDHELVVSYAELGRRYELEPALDAAMAIGRTGSVIDRSADQVRAVARGASFDVDVITYDRAVLDARMTAFVASIEQDGRDASVGLRAGATGAAATWRVEPSQVGIDVDAEALSSAAHAALGALGTTTVATAVSAAQRTLEPAITTEEAAAAATRANAIGAVDLRLAAGDTEYAIPAETIRGWVSVAATDAGDYAVEVDTSGVEPLLAAMLSDVATAAVDASFKFAGKGTVVVAVPGHQGLSVDLTETASRVSAALEARAAGSGGQSVDVAAAVTEPRFTTAEAEAAAPRVRRVSRWTTYFTVYEGNGFGRNISIPTRTINKTVVPPRKWFDFLETIGKITRAKGYVNGGAIINGRTETTGALGGGMCSCSTTLFNAALRAGLQMGQRRNHYYYITRYPVGLDATVWEGSAGRGLSMRFRNDTEYPILIRGTYRPGAVGFEIWTVPTGRRVRLTAPIIRDRTTARDSIEYTDDVPIGVTRRVEWPTNGFDAWVTRYVRDRDGNLIHEDTFFSHYGAVDGVTEVGVSSSDPRNGTIVYR